MELIDYYDSENNVKLGVEERKVIHSKGLWHREVAVWVLNEKDEILLQKRSALKDYAPNKYSICAGHIDSGEDIEIAALRELFEEVGLKATKNDLITIGVFKSENDNNNHYTYTYLVLTDKKISEYVMQKEEVSELKYISLQELEEIIRTKDDTVTFSGKYYVKIIFEKLKKFCEERKNG